MEWISVDERLPDDYGLCLTYHPDWGVRESYYNGESGGIEVGLINDLATHWMPLPPPPKDK